MRGRVPFGPRGVISLHRCLRCRNSKSSADLGALHFTEMAEEVIRNLRVLIANEKRERLELLAQVVAGLGHEVIARDHGVGVAVASMLLDAGARTDVRDEFLKSTPLGWACRWGRVALVELLLTRGADPIEAGAEPWATPLAWAERRQHVEIVSALRRHGADH